MAEKDVKVKVSADISSFEKSMKDLTSKLNGLSKEFSNVSKKSDFSKNSRSFDKINSSVSKTKTTMENTNKSFEKMKSAISSMKAKSLDTIKSKASSLSTVFENMKSKIKNVSSTKFSKLTTDLSSTITKSKTLNTAFTSIKATMSKLSTSKLTSGLSNLTSKFKESISGSEKLKNTFNQLSSGNYGGSFKSLQSGLQSIISNIPTSIKLISVLVAGINELYKAGSKRFFEGLKDIQSTLSPITNTVSSFASTIKSSLQQITGLDLSLNGFIQTGVGYEDTMARVQGITNTSGKEFEALSNKAREMGAETRYSATEAGEAMIEMGQQGWSSSQIISGLEGVLNLATVGNISLADSAQLVTNGMNALGIEAKDTSRYVDVIANASVKSGTNVSQFAEAMENASSTAGVLNISIEDLATGIGLMGNNFIKGGKAGTSMKTFLANMSKPTKQMTTCMQEYNLEGARQKILSGDLVGGYKDMAKQMEGLTNEQKSNIAATLAGKEGMAGFLAITNSGVKGIENLEEAMKASDGVAKHMAETFDNTLKGALYTISSAIQERMLQVFDNLKPAITEGANAIKDFLNAWNKGDLEGGLGGLSDKVNEWSQSIPNAMGNVISSINNFISGGSLDSILRMGGDIVQGICNGIIQNKDGITQGITELISKACDWINNNGDSIHEAGKAIIDAIKIGIETNSTGLNDALETVWDIINGFAQGKSDVMGSIGKTIGATMITGFLEGAIQDVTNKVGNVFALVIGTIGGFTAQIAQAGLDMGNSFMESFLGQDTWNKCKEDLKSTLDWLWDLNGDNNTTSKAQDAGLADGQKYGEKTKEGLDQTKTETDKSASQIGEGISQNITNKLETMDTAQLKDLENELKSLQSTTSSVASGIGKSFASIQTSSRTSFMGMCNIARNQFLNMSNIARNQMINISNIVKNQSLNARNSLTRQFISMSKVASTQLTNVRTVTVSKMMSIAKVVNTQASNARNNLTRQFMSMAAVARNQMANIYSSVSSYMSKIASSVNRSMNLKVNVAKTVTTTNKVINEKASSMSALANNTFSALSRNVMPEANTMALSSQSFGLGETLKSIGSTNSSNENITLEIPVNLDGKQVAKATAQYMDGELKIINTRNNRKKGVK